MRSAGYGIVQRKEYSPSIKPWILPEFEALVRNGTIRMEFGACVEEITEDKVMFRSGQNELVSIKMMLYLP